MKCGGGSQTFKQKLFKASDSEDFNASAKERCGWECLKQILQWQEQRRDGLKPLWAKAD